MRHASFLIFIGRRAEVDFVSKTVNVIVAAN